MRIALLDDDQALADLVKLWLKAAGHTVEHFASGEPLIEAAVADRFDLYILDWFVPGLNGIGVVIKLRESGSKRPVLFLTQFDSAENAADAIRVGADDYLVKPVSQDVLTSRVQALLRSRGEALPEDVTVGRYRTDARASGVIVGGAAIALDPREFELARYLLAHHSRLVTRSELKRHLWGLEGADGAARTQTIESQVQNIGAKLGLDGSNGLKLVPVSVVGYRLEERDGSLG